MSVAMPVTNRIILDSDKDVENRTLKAQFGNGYGQAAPNGTNARVETWNIVWAPLTAAEKTTVEAALDSVGGWGTLLWTPCGETVQKKYRLVDGKYKTTPDGASRFKISCTLEQRFESWA